MILLAFGANMTSVWGAPSQSIAEACRRLTNCGCAIRALSPFYETAPLGPTQETFINAAAVADTALSPDALLRLIKRLERNSGRRQGRRWGPRPLDIDIIDYKGRVLNWRLRARAPEAAMRLVLPHAGAHMRPFVLQPVADVAPRWRHPIFRKTAAALLRELNNPAGGQVLGKREESTAGLASSAKINY